MYVKNVAIALARQTLYVQQELRSSRQQFNLPTPTRRRIKSNREIGELVFNPVNLRIRS